MASEVSLSELAPYNTVPEMIGAVTALHAEAELVVSPEERLTYGGADRAADQMARRLVRVGVGKGTRVGLLGPSGGSWITAALAVMRLGAVLVPISTFATGPELAWTLRHSDIHTLVVRPRFLRHEYLAALAAEVPSLRDYERSGSDPLLVPELPSLRRVLGLDSAGVELPRWAAPIEAIEEGPVPTSLLRALEAAVHPSDPAVIMYSSGSTAEPKGAIHTNGTVVRHPYQVNQRRGLGADDRVYLAMPLFWVGGFHHGFIAGYQAGSCLIVDETFDVGRAVEAIERETATVVFSWPHQAASISQEPTFASRAVSSLRTGSRNMVLPPGVTSDPTHRSNWLGMSETFGAHLISDMSIDLPEERWRSFGQAVPGIEHVLLDPDTGQPCAAGETGVLHVRGYSVMAGRVRAEREEVFEADGWYRTGDLGRFDDEGWFFFEGRADDVIKAGGVNVSPAEVEAILSTVDGVRSAYVVGVQGPDGSTVLEACVVTEPGQAVDPEAARAAVRERLSAYKVPRHVTVLAEDELPMTATLKVRRGVLAEVLAEKLASG